MVAAKRGDGYSKIELLYFERCPGSVETLGILHGIVAEEDLPAQVVPVMVSGPGDRSYFPGSPTILVDGEDLFPTDHHAHAMSCRIYSTPEGPKNYPTAAMVRTALAQRLSER